VAITCATKSSEFIYTNRVGFRPGDNPAFLLFIFAVGFHQPGGPALNENISVTGSLVRDGVAGARLCHTLVIGFFVGSGNIHALAIGFAAVVALDVAVVTVPVDISLAGSVIPYDVAALAVHPYGPASPRLGGADLIFLGAVLLHDGPVFTAVAEHVVVAITFLGGVTAGVGADALSVGST
jgi:hypothetical protein